MNATAVTAVTIVTQGCALVLYLLPAGRIDFTAS